MRRLAAAAVGLAATIAQGGDTVSVPWEEVKTLYRESVRREIMDKAEESAKQRRPQVHAIDEAVYRVSVGRQSASGEVLLSGRVLEGGPDPIPLFDAGVVLGPVRTVAGGTLLCRPEDGGRIAFLPGGQTNFQVELMFLLPAREDGRSRAVAFTPPTALRGSLTVALPPDLTLVAASGLADSNAVRRLAPGEPVVIRFSEASATAEAALEADLLTTVGFRDEAPVISLLVAPVKPVNRPLMLRAPPGFKLDTLSTSSPWSAGSDPGVCRVSLPADFREQLRAEFVPERQTAGHTFAFVLPAIEGNTGQEGWLTTTDPDDGQIVMTSDAPMAEVSVGRLPPALRQQAARGRACSRVKAGQRVTAELKRFAAVSTPPIVMDSVRFFSSFEENGGVLSVLQLDVPAEAGPRLRVKAAPEAEVWSLTVNGERRNVYANGDGAWVIPLAAAGTSRVELAFLCAQPKLGLQGRLETAVPETPFPARHVLVGLALPARVEVLSVEGPVNPAPGTAVKPPAEFAGKPHYFSRAFYKGEGMKVAAFYKEPVKNAEQGGAR
jgi:hypothetical protein